MKKEMIIRRIIQVTVPSTDDGRRIIRNERLNVITKVLANSSYQRLSDMPLAKVYHHQDFKSYKPAILISCHIDSLYGCDDYFTCLKDDELQGTLDNSACNGVLLEAMRHCLLPVQALVSFTGDEEKESRGVDQTITILQKEAIFDHLEMVITLDLTEEGYRSTHYTIENYFVAKSNKRSLLKFSNSEEIKKYLRTIIASAVFIQDADADESWQYDEYDLNCFSLCLPCRLLGTDMHEDTGVAIRLDSLAGYIKALQRLSQGINEDLTRNVIPSDVCA